MPETLYIRELIQSARKFDVEKYKEPDFQNTHAFFEGTPKKHATDKTKVIIVSDPFAGQKSFYEFPISAIDYIEDVETITTADGRSAPRMRVWIRKGTIGFRYDPFIV